MTKAKGAHAPSHRLRKHKGDTRELAAQLAPFEELFPEDSEPPAARGAGSELVAQENGAIVVGRQTPTLPDDVIEVSERKARVEPVLIVIVGVMLAFILFIAWQVSQMPNPAK